MPSTMFRISRVFRRACHSHSKSTDPIKQSAPVEPKSSHSFAGLYGFYLGALFGGLAGLWYDRIRNVDAYWLVEKCDGKLVEARCDGRLVEKLDPAYGLGMPCPKCHRSSNMNCPLCAR